MKGHIKEAVGVLTDDDTLKNEEKLDQVVPAPPSSQAMRVGRQGRGGRRA
jgi:hypothetical protein